MTPFSHIRFAAGSDVGKRRSNNEDTFGVYPSLGVFCVADGMGGGDDGEIASAATVRAVESFATSHPHPLPKVWTRDSMIRGIRAAEDSASSWIYRRAEEKGLKGCGSTFVGIFFDATNPSSAVVMHAGDSRLYRIRDGEIIQLTRDHSPAALIGVENESEVNPMFRGMILRAVGVRPSVELEQTEVEVRQGDSFLLCSDGLYRMVPERKVVTLVEGTEDLQIAVNSLIAAANEAGGVDNVTAVLMKIGVLPPSIDGENLPDVAAEEGALLQEDSETGDTAAGTSFTFDTAGSVSTRTGMNGDSCSSNGMVSETVTQTDTEPNPKPESIPASKEFLHLKTVLLSALAAVGFAVAIAIVVVINHPSTHVDPIPPVPPDPEEIVQNNPPVEDEEIAARRGKLVADIEDLLLDMPVADRRDRLGKAKWLLDVDSDGERLIAEESMAEYRKKIVLAEGRLVAEIKNECRAEVTVDGKLVPAGRTLPISYDSGVRPEDWMARSDNHEPVALPIDFDGKTIIVNEALFEAADMEREHERKVTLMKNREKLFFNLKRLLHEGEDESKREHLDSAQKLLDEDESGARLFTDEERTMCRDRIVVLLKKIMPEVSESESVNSNAGEESQ